MEWGSSSWGCWWDPFIGFIELNSLGSCSRTSLEKLLYILTGLEYLGITQENLEPVAEDREVSEWPAQPVATDSQQEKFKENY